MLTHICVYKHVCVCVYLSIHLSIYLSTYIYKFIYATQKKVMHLSNELKRTQEALAQQVATNPRKQHPPFCSTSAPPI